MADYTLLGKPAVVVIDEGRFAGAEITVNLDVGMGVYLDVERLMRREDGETSDEKRVRLKELYDLLADDILVSWNLVDRRGRAIPPDQRGLGRVPAELIGEVLAGWLSAITGAAAPFEVPSLPGEPAAESSQPS